MDLRAMEAAAERNDRASFPSLSDPSERARFKENQARELRLEAKRLEEETRGLLCAIHHKPVIRTVGGVKPGDGATFCCEDC